MYKLINANVIHLLTAIIYCASVLAKEIRKQARTIKQIVPSYQVLAPVFTELLKEMYEGETPQKPVHRSGCDSEKSLVEHSINVSLPYSPFTISEHYLLYRAVRSK